MAMTTNTESEIITSQPHGKDDPIGEIRADAEGKLYVYIPEVKEVKENKSKKVKDEINMDLNGDGVVDIKDVSIAAKVMRRVRNKK